LNFNFLNFYLIFIFYNHLTNKLIDYQINKYKKNKNKNKNKKIKIKIKIEIS